MKGYVSEEALAAYAQLVAESQGLDFSEGDTYDFARCMRPDGSFYGTGGKCRKGTEAGAKEDPDKVQGSIKAGKAAAAKRVIGAVAKQNQADRRERGTTVAADLAGQHAKEMGVSKSKLEKEYKSLLDKNPDMDLGDLYMTAQKNLKSGGRDRALTPKEEAEVDARLGRNRPSRVAEGAQREQMRAERADRLRDGETKPAKFMSSAQNKKEAKEKAEHQRQFEIQELQRAASKGDKEAMKELIKLRSEGKIGKEPGFAPGAKARQESKEAQEVGAAKPARKPRATSAELKTQWDESQKAVKAAKAEEARVRAETKGDKSREALKRRLAAGNALDRAERAALKIQDRFFAAAKRESRAAMTPEQRREEREWDKQKRELG